jgi:NADH-quinone oxidoreductase subunit J
MLIIKILKGASFNNRIITETDAVKHTGIRLMTDYLLPFETVSIILLAALIGAAYIARRERTKE